MAHSRIKTFPCLPMITRRQIICFILSALLFSSCALLVDDQPQRIVRVEALADPAFRARNPRWDEEVRGLRARKAGSASALTRTILCAWSSTKSAQDEKSRALRMKQIICRRVIIGKHGNVLIREWAIVIGYADVLNGVGEEALIESDRSLDDFFDLQALLVFRGNDDDILDRVGAYVLGSARREDVSLREDAALRFHKGASDFTGRTRDGADEIGDDDAVGRELSLRQLEKLSRGQMERHRIGVIGVQQNDVVLIGSAGQEQPPVLCVKMQAVAFPDIEVILCDLNYFGIDLDDIDFQRRKFLLQFLRNRTAAEADDEYSLGVGSEGKSQ